jgi:hypothetical protein
MVFWLVRSDAALPGVGRCHHLLLLSLHLSVAVVSNPRELRAASRPRCSDTTVRRYVAPTVVPPVRIDSLIKLSSDYGRPMLLLAISRGPNASLFPY